MARSWTIGSKNDCDLVVALPRVSGHHCRLTRDDEGYVLEDLGSTNGTYVNGVRVSDVVRVNPGDAITFGLLTPMPWPPDADDPRGTEAPAAPGRPQPAPTLSLKGNEMVIGRAPDCGLALDLPMVSSRHARLFRADGRTWIEDLGSANGTFVNAERVHGRAAVEAGDRIALGSCLLVYSAEATDAAVGVTSGAVAAPPETPVLIVPHPSPTGDRPRDPATTVPPARRLAALLTQGPLAAVLIVMAVKPDTTAATGPVSGSVAATLGWLGLAAVWFGLSSAVLGGLIDVRRVRDALSPGGATALGTRLLVLGGVCAWQCGLAWLLVANVSGLKAPWAAAVSVMLLASAVGAAGGLLIVALEARPAVAWASLAVVMLSLSWLGGGGQAPTRTTPWVSAVSGSLPTRWAFEGLLLLESDRRPTPSDAGTGEVGRSHDLAENFFPAGSERMGTRADLMALALMAVGLTAVAGFTARERGRTS